MELFVKKLLLLIALFTISNLSYGSIGKYNHITDDGFVYILNTETGQLRACKLLEHTYEKEKWEYRVACSPWSTGDSKSKIEMLNYIRG